MNDAAPPAFPPIKDTIDANSGRFEFSSRRSRSGSRESAALRRSSPTPRAFRATRSRSGCWYWPAPGWSSSWPSPSWDSAYANLLTVSAKISRNTKDVEKYSKGVRDHARVVIIALSVALAGMVTFAVNRLFAPPTTPEGAVTTAAGFVAKETKLTTDMIHFDRMEADSDAYVATFSVPTTGNGFTVRVAKKDGSVAQATQQKKP